MWLFFLLLFAVCSFFYVALFLIKGNTADHEEKSASEQKKNDSAGLDEDFLKAAVSNEDTSVHIIRVSNPAALNAPFEIDDAAGRRYRRVFSGRRINIAITGVDSRLGSRFKHADANHILSILIDSAKIEIIAIPRDTEADAGLDDTTGQNKLTVVRGIKGRRAYLKEAARIAGLDRIHYYVEFGFSQAMGILEWLGYKESGSALQVLRSRRGLGSDFQRSYNQAQFIRQAILGHFEKFTGVLSNVFIHGGLALVETNLTASRAKDIISKLENKNFPANPDDIVVKVRPPIYIKFKRYDFSNPEIMKILYAKFRSVEVDKVDSNTTVTDYVAGILQKAIDKAILDSADNPTLVINGLRTYFDQRAWLQISNHSTRCRIREDVSNLLAEAYRKKGKPERARAIIGIITAEKRLFGANTKKVVSTDSIDFNNSSTF